MNPRKISPPKQFEVPDPNNLSYQQSPSPDPSQTGSPDERQNRSAVHRHNGLDAPPIDLMDLVGLIEVVSAAPTLVPKNFFDQVKIYSNGGTRRLYVYVTDSAGSGAWRYTALT